MLHRPASSPHRVRLSRLVAILAVVVLAVACKPVPPSGADGTYVALGDSFVAGPGIQPIAPDTPLECLQSGNNWPKWAAAPLDVAAIVDVSCSGAITDDITNPQELTGPNPPAQIDALGPETEVVTLGIGGNDIGFVSIIGDCIRPIPFMSPCVDDFTAGGGDELRDRIDATIPKIDDVLTQVKAGAPNATIYLVGYPALLPQSGDCYPRVPFYEADITYLRGIVESLNAMLSSRAAANGVNFIDLYTPSIGHDVCQDKKTMWYEGIVLAGIAAPVHPNVTGMIATGDIIRPMLVAAGH